MPAVEFPISLTDLPRAHEAAELPRADGKGTVRQISRESIEAGDLPPKPFFVCPYCKVYLEGPDKRKERDGSLAYNCPLGCGHQRKIMTAGAAAMYLPDAKPAPAREPSPHDARPQGPLAQEEQPDSRFNARRNRVRIPSDANPPPAA